MLTSQEALSALKEADAVGQRSRQAYSYSQGAPHFFIWGIAWIVGYGASALAPAFANWVWLGVVILGTLASIIAGGRRQSRSVSTWQVFALLGVIYAFSAGLFTLVWPINGLQMAAYWPLLCAAIYAGIGLWLGIRYVIVGAVLAAAALGGYFFLRENFLLWMAFVGGGTLILTGFWLRKA
ncbi:MAG TPA: hypothetical protein VIJ72_06530 [Rhizomicrobium sp.]